MKEELTDYELRNIGRELILMKFSSDYPYYFAGLRNKTWREILDPLEAIFIMGYNYRKNEDNINRGTDK